MYSLKVCLKVFSSNYDLMTGCAQHSNLAMIYYPWGQQQGGRAWCPLLALFYQLKIYNEHTVCCSIMTIFTNVPTLYAYNKTLEWSTKLKIGLNLSIKDWVQCKRGIDGDNSCLKFLFNFRKRKLNIF